MLSPLPPHASPTFRPEMRRSIFLCLSILCMVAGAELTAQEQSSSTPARPAATPPPATSPIEADPTTADTLRTLARNHAAVASQLEDLRKQLGNVKDDAAKADLNQQIVAQEKRRDDLEHDFMEVASGVDEQDFNTLTEPQTPPTVQQEFNALIMPLISDLRELTKRPRAIEALQQQISTQDARVVQAEAALLRLEDLIKEVGKNPNAQNKDKDALLVKGLQRIVDVWNERRTEATDRAKVLRYQLSELRESGADFWGQMAVQARKAVFTRGVNILLALLAFFVVLTVLRAAYFYTMRYVPLRQYQRLSFAARLLDVVHQGASVVLAMLAALLVLYARGDWLLGSLAVLALLGLILAAKSGLTHYMEQVRMLLNLGAVREGERVFINGVPWKVGRINLFTQLTNPAIGGPGIRMPIERLMEMNSRISTKDESWFPCKKGEWILMEGKDLAKVLSIGPDYVELDVRGGQHRWLATADFMKLDVTSLHNGFALSTTFGIDYAHQADATTRIPQLLASEIEAGLLKQVPKEHLLLVLVEFTSASASSLDYLIVARFTGDQADSYPSLGRALQRLAVDSCNKHGWAIPFPQMVMHTHALPADSQAAHEPKKAPSKKQA